MPNFIEIGGVTRKPLVDLTRNDPYDALHFHTGVAKINIFKVVFWEGTLCTLLIMLIIMDDPLSSLVYETVYS